MARFLKSRYFPDSHFLEALVGARPSYAWRNLLYGRELLRKGLKRSIGNGRSTRVWLDKWIEDPELGLRAPWIKYKKILRSWPWFLWSIWKCRNDFIFKGKRWLPEEIKEKAFNEAEEWFLAQEVDQESQQISECAGVTQKRKWKPPPKDWVMCNVGFEWLKQTKKLGVAWVLRNHRGVVLLHSRRAFSNIRSLDEARLASILWAAESISSLHYNQVVFAGDFKDIFLAIKKPLQWPAFRYHVEELNRFLCLMPEFKLCSVCKEENRGATIIAQSVTREGREQSYVANGHPSWLFEFFVNESRLL
ncbi:hypothetical protein Bca52824_094848 [Brassica carinata]|uniref:RNase H type-1 domain-containing protein n=1 Tax=Brassica carinata TaxID=52824 RepID=A0A8X7P2U3_BRACI|nr:hypothetical protein Bca52824_094848 [Brassica carinata]